MSWFRNLLAKGNKDGGGGSGSGAASPGGGTAGSSGSTVGPPPPLPPRPVGGLGHFKQPSSSSLMPPAAPYVPTPHALLVEQLMGDYLKLGGAELAAQAKLAQILEVAFTTPITAAAAASNAAASASPTPAPGGVLAVTLASTLTEDAQKRNTHLLGFLSTAGSRLADRVVALTGGVSGSAAAARHGSIASNTPLNAALADKQAARWLTLLSLFSPFPPPATSAATEPYGARLLELLRLLAYKDEKRIACLNASRLSTVLLQCIHALAEMHPSTLEHMQTIERCGNEAPKEEVLSPARHRRGTLNSHSSESSFSGSRPRSDDSDDGSDFELEAAEDASTISHTQAALSTAAMASPAASSSARTTLEYSRLPLVDRLCHLQSLLSIFLGSLAHAIPTTMELVRSNTLIMLIRMCVGGGAANSVNNRRASNVDGSMLGSSIPSAAYTPTGAVLIPSSSSRGSIETKALEVEDSEDDIDAVDPHTVGRLSHHAQVLSLQLLLKLLGSRPCLDVKVCVYLSKSSSLRLLLSLLRPAGFRAHQPSTIVDLMQSLVQVLADSSHAQREGVLSYNLFDEFAQLAGYDQLLAATLWLRTLTLQAEAERIQAKGEDDLTRFGNEDPCAVHDNPFLNPTSLYPVHPAPAPTHFARLSPVQRCVDLSSCLSRLLELLHSLIFVSPHPLRLPGSDVIPNRSRLMLAHPDDADDADAAPPASHEMRVKNLDAVRLVLFVFVKCPLVGLRQEILNRMLLLYSAHPDNIWLLHQLHPITYFIEMIPYLTAPPLPGAPSGGPEAQQPGVHLQKLVWRLLEYIVNVSNVVPLQEITTIGLILRIRSAAELTPTTPTLVTPPNNQSQRRSSLLAFEATPSIRQLSSLRTLLQYQDGVQGGGGGYPGDSCVRLILVQVQELIEENSIFRDVFRETEVLAVLIQHLAQLAAYLDAQAQVQKGEDLSSTAGMKLVETLRLRPLLLDLSTYALSLRTLQLLLTSSPPNLRMFREFGGSAALFALLTPVAYRAPALGLIGCQLVASNFQEILEALQACHADPVLQVALLGTLVRMLSSARSVGARPANRGSAPAEAFVLPPTSGTGSTLSAASQAASDAASARIKDLYRSLAGFEAIFSLLSRMDSTFTTTESKGPASSQNAQQWRLLEGILCIIGLSICGHARNREYVWSYSVSETGRHGTWKALAYAINLSGVLKTPYAPKAVQAVMNLATETPQNPQPSDDEEDEFQTKPAVPTEQQPWCLIYPPPSGDAPASTAAASTVCPVIHSPDGVLALLRILVDCRLDVQVGGLASLHALIALSTKTTAALRNLEAMCQGGVLEYFLSKFGAHVRLVRTTATQQQQAPDLIEEARSLAATDSSLTEARIVQLLHQRALLCQGIIEGLAAHRLTTRELKQLVTSFHDVRARQLRQALATGDETQAAAAIKVSPALYLYQFFLRLLRNSQWSSAAGAGDFVEFDLRPTGSACLDIPSFGRSSWPVSGVFSFSCWLNIRSLVASNEPLVNRTAITPLQLFEFTSTGDASAPPQHLWSASILPSGFLLVSAGSVSSRASVVTRSTTHPWRTVNLDTLDEKGPGQGQALFEKHRFVPNTWKHVALCHEKAKGQNRLLLSLYVDGQFVQQVQVQCAPTGNQSSVVAARGCIGVPPSEPQSPQRATTSTVQQSGLVWWMNGMYFMSGLLSQSEIQLMWRRGPGYVGAFAPHNTLTTPVKPSLSSMAGALSLARTASNTTLFSGSTPNPATPAPVVQTIKPPPRTYSPTDESWPALMEGERTVFAARAALDASRAAEDALPTLDKTASSSSSSGGLGGGNAADSNFFDADKVVFAFQAHHVWSLSEHYGSGLEVDVDTSADVSADEMATVVANAESKDPGMVLPNTQGNARMGLAMAFPVAYASGGATPVHPLSFAATLRSAGGVATLIALLSSEEVSTSGDLLLVLSLLFAVVSSTVADARDMARMGGYQLVASIVQSKRALLTIEIMRVMCDLVEGGARLVQFTLDAKLMQVGTTEPMDLSSLGVTRVPLICCEERTGYTYIWSYLIEGPPSTDTRLTLANSLALEHLLLNTSLWVDCDPVLQAALLARIRLFRLLEPKPVGLVSAFAATHVRQLAHPDFEVSASLRRMISALHKQSIIFNWTADLPPASASQMLTSLVPLPYRTPGASRDVLSDWVGCGFLPAQRYRLDLTEGPLRQRKKMAAQEDFYLHYRIHVPKLSKALQTLQAKHDGTANAAKVPAHGLDESASPPALPDDDDAAPASSVSSDAPISAEQSPTTTSFGKRVPATMDLSTMQELTAKLSVSLDAKRQLLEELPQLAISTLTQITQHSAITAAEGDSSNRARRSRARRSVSQAAGSGAPLPRSSLSETDGPPADSETMTSIDEATTIITVTSPPVPSELQVDDDSSDSSSTDEDDDEPTPRSAASPARRPFGSRSSSAAASPMHPPRKSIALPEGPVLAPAPAGSDDDDTSSSFTRRDVTTRVRSLAAVDNPDIPSAVVTVDATAAAPSVAAPTAVVPEAIALDAASAEASEAVSVELDEYEKILRLLEPGDTVLPGDLYACSRVVGLDKAPAVVVMCARHIYVIDNFSLSGEGRLVGLEPGTAATGDSSTADPLFRVEVTARPISVPWNSEDGDSSQRHDTGLDETPTEPVPPLAPEDIVLRVSKITKTSPDDLSSKYRSKSDAGAASDPPPPSSVLPPMNDPEDPLASAVGLEVLTSVHKLTYASLRELHKRRYNLMALGLEFFGHDGVTLLLVFETPEEREHVHARVLAVTAAAAVALSEPGAGDAAAATVAHAHTGSTGMPTNALDLGLTVQGGSGLFAPSHARMRSWRKEVCAKWQRGEMSNFAYLMFCNTCSGRSYNDFTQYPVFPWILSDYTSATLALDDERVYRDLSKPMGAIGAERAKLFQARFAAWDDPSGMVPPFHYGSHYSSCAAVLYYLIRLEPFTQYHLHLQSGKFDHADRLFFDLAHTWRSASSQGGLSDVKELIPEFFYLPDFLSNSNRFDLGEHQRGGYVGDVKLPPWALGDPRIFVRLHRRALESPHVSARLHSWIDLVFGAKQRGPAAVAAQNVFYWITYEDVVDVNAITDPQEKASLISQLENFGQTPSQIFRHAHPRKQPTPASHRITIASHPQLLHPVTATTPLVLPRRVACLYWSGKLERLFALDECKAIVPGSLSKYMSWGHADCSLRFHILVTSPRHRVADEVVAVHEAMHAGQITIAAATDDGQCVITGGADGLVKVWRLHPEHKHKQPLLTRSLPAHWSAVTALAHAWSYSLLITAGADGQVLFYDMNRLSLQRKLPVHPYPVTSLAIDPYRGDVVTCAGPHLYVWDVNGGLVAQHLGSSAQGEVIESAVWTQGPEGAWIEPNLITGHRDGSIRVWRLVYPTAAVGPSEPIGSPNPAFHRRDSMASAPPASSPSTASAATPAAYPAESRPPSLSDADEKSSGNSSSSSARCGLTGSLGVGFLALETCHRLESVHSSPVTSLHTSVSEWRRMWSGDRSGRVQAWQISSDEHWLKDAEAKNCQACQVKFSVLERRHHCRECGLVFCSRCSSHRIPLEHLGFSQSVRVCDGCYSKVTSTATGGSASSTPVAPLTARSPAHASTTPSGASTAR